MVRVFILTGLVWAIGAVQGFAQPVQFFESLQDIPLMPGLIEQVDDTVFFDKPDGRVVESVADMAGFSQEAVESYYMSALPQFGWENAGGGRFNRGGESLELVFEGADDLGILRVLVQPR